MSAAGLVVVGDVAYYVGGFDARFAPNALSDRVLYAHVDALLRSKGDAP